MPSNLIEKTMRVNRLPHIWCPGCGHGILMRDVAQAIENCGLDPHEWSAFAFGIGVDRVTSLKYGITDIRLEYENDARFLGQF